MGKPTVKQLNALIAQRDTVYRIYRSLYRNPNRAALRAFYERKYSTLRAAADAMQRQMSTNGSLQSAAGTRRSRAAAQQYASYYDEQSYPQLGGAVRWAGQSLSASWMYADISQQIVNTNGN